MEDGALRRWDHIPRLAGARPSIFCAQCCEDFGQQYLDLSCWVKTAPRTFARSEEHTSELQSQSNLVCRLLLEKKKITTKQATQLPMCRNCHGTDISQNCVVPTH